MPAAAAEFERAHAWSRIEKRQFVFGRRQRSVFGQRRPAAKHRRHAIPAGAIGCENPLDFRHAVPRSQRRAPLVAGSHLMSTRIIDAQYSTSPGAIQPATWRRVRRGGNRARQSRTSGTFHAAEFRERTPMTTRPAYVVMFVLWSVIVAG